MTAPSKTSVSPADPSPHVAAAHDKILIVDFGSQVTQLIARRVREEGVYSEIVPFNKAEAAFAEMKPKAVILSGGPASVLDDNAPSAPLSILTAGVPVLGICYGEQTMAQQLGGTVEAGHHREFGRAAIEITDTCALFDGVWEVGGKYDVWMSHGDRVTKMPEGFAPSPRRRARRSRSSPTTSENSMRCSSTPKWRIRPTAQTDPQLRAQHRRLHRRLDHARLPRGSHREDPRPGRQGQGDLRSVRRRRSSVAAVLIHEAIGDQLTCVFVDHGMLRKDEAKTVVDLFRHHYNIPLVHVDASKTFLGELEGVTDPEVKRKTIGRLFIDVFDAEAKKIGGADFLAQGTLYPDVIESVSFTGGPSVTIKSHHNVGGFPRA
jgi:GMP synthase (glutamine-hydrolysing)